MESYP